MILMMWTGIIATFMLFFILTISYLCYVLFCVYFLNILNTEYAKNAWLNPFPIEMQYIHVILRKDVCLHRSGLSASLVNGALFAAWIMVLHALGTLPLPWKLTWRYPRTKFHIHIQPCFVFGAIEKFYLMVSKGLVCIKRNSVRDSSTGTEQGTFTDSDWHHVNQRECTRYLVLGQRAPLDSMHTFLALP